MSQRSRRQSNRRLNVFLLAPVFLAQTLGGFFSPVFAAEEIAAPITLDLAADVDDRISMSFDGASLKDVLLIFSQQSGLNFAASQEVEARRITVYFENVAPKDALDAILTANGLTYVRNPGSDIFIVYPVARAQASKIETKVIRLKFMRLSGSPLNIGGQTTIDQLSTSTSTSSASTGSSSSSASSSSESSSSGSDTPSERGADTLIQKMLSPLGKMAVDLNTNSVILTDTPDSIKSIEKVLTELDVPPSQVILEVHIMEVRKSLASDMGIEWGGADGALGAFSAGIRTTDFPFRDNAVEKLFGKAGESVAGTSTTDVRDAADALSPQMTLGVIDASNFRATLHAIVSDGDTKILARPRVLTQNNEAAMIKLISNAAIGIQTTTTDTGGTANETEEAERADIGVVLKMTPQINDDNSVLLFLEPSVSTVADSQFFPGQFSDPTTRLVRTMARVKDNQTLVIGGLIDSQGASNSQKIPVLGDLPLIGHAFRYDSRTDFDRELVVFITPHIVRGVSSLGSRSATAQGEDISLKRVLKAFIDKEMDHLAREYEGFEKTKNTFFTKEQTLIRDAERRYTNPVIEEQMTQALDAFSPQMIDQQMAQSLDALSAKRALSGKQ